MAHIVCESVLKQSRISPLQSGDSQRFSTIENISDYTGEPRGENVDALASIALAENDDYESENPHFGKQHRPPGSYSDECFVRWFFEHFSH